MMVSPKNIIPKKNTVRLFTISQTSTVRVLLCCLLIAVMLLLNYCEMYLQHIQLKENENANVSRFLGFMKLTFAKIPNH